MQAGEIASIDAFDHGAFLCREGVDSHICPRKPLFDDGLDPVQVEIVIGLGQGAPEFGLELWKLIRRYRGQGGAD